MATRFIYVAGGRSNNTPITTVRDRPFYVTVYDRRCLNFGIGDASGDSRLAENPCH